MPIVVVKCRERLFQGKISASVLSASNTLHSASMQLTPYQPSIICHSVLLSATHKMALNQVTINDLKEFAMDQSTAGRFADPAAGGPIR